MSLLNEMLRNLDSRRQSPDLEGGIQVPVQAVGRSYRPVAGLILLIIVIGLGVVLVLDRYQLPHQAGLPVAKMPVQSGEAGMVPVEDSLTRSVPLSQGDARADNSNAGITEMSLDFTQANQPEDTTELPVEELQHAASQPQPETNSAPEIALINEQLAIESPVQQGTLVAPEATPVSADPDAMETSVRQQSTAAKSEQGMLMEVENLLQRNAEAEARHRLEQFLVTHPDSAATIETLFRLNLRMGDLDMAQRLLDSSSHLPFLKIIELRAQLEVQRGNLMDAVKMLESATPNYEKAAYYALLAGLYQKLGRFREAANHYRQLLKNEPEQGAFWLGLAVSLDSLEQHQDALVAFQRTRDSGQFDGDVQQYVEQRIAFLSR